MTDYTPVSAPGRFAPLSDGHPGVGGICPICNTALVIGDEPTLLATGPASEEDRQREAKGRAYTAEAVIAHARCVHG